MRGRHPLLKWAAGPGLIVLSLYLQLAPKFVVSNALLVHGRAAQELVLRRATAEVMLVCLACELAWTAWRPAGVSMRTAGALLVLATALSGANTVLAYTTAEGSYRPGLAFGLQVASGLCTVPVSQCAVLWRLTQVRSPLQWRVVGWIVTITVGTLALLIPALAAMVPTVALSCAFPAVVGVLLCCTAAAAAEEEEEEDAGAEKGGGKYGEKKKVKQQKQYGDDGSATVGGGGGSQSVLVPWSTAVHYVLLAVVCGTNAEAINDIAMGLCVRAEQVKGLSELAITNNLSVLLSQLLALASDTSLSTWVAANETQRGLGFLAVWGACQLMRAYGMGWVEAGGASGSTLLAVFVFVDKFTGCVYPCSAMALAPYGTELSCPQHSLTSQYLCC
jgi:hypothetical protein